MPPTNVHVPDETHVMVCAHDMPVNVRALPRSGKQVALVSTPGQCAALAKNHGLVAVEHFQAKFFLQPLSRGRVRLHTHFTAKIVQRCVISGEPLLSEVGDDFTVIFEPVAQQMHNQNKTEREVILEVLPQETEETDFFDGNEINLGFVVEEFFELALDPYPRKEGAQFQPVCIGEAQDNRGENDISPFAILKNLATH